MSESTVYAIASGKGGVGKTTTAINLGAMLADRGHEVVVLDTDLGMANLADFLDFEIGKPTLHEVLAGDADFENAIYRAPGGIDVLPSGVDIEAFAKSDPTNLQHVIRDLRDEYDYVLLDTGAGVSYDTLVPLALADGVLLVATPDVASVRDTAKTGELAERVESEVTGAVLTQRSSDILNADDVEETLSTDVLAVVPADEAVPMGIDAGRPLAAFAPNAPAGQAYRELAAVLTGEVDPDPELDLDGADEEDQSETDDSAETTDVDADAFSAPDLAENTRDADASGDQSAGLLGGELSTAADEIRKQAGDSSAASGDSSAASRDAGVSETDRATDREDATETESPAAKAGAGGATKTADPGEADVSADPGQEAESTGPGQETETSDATEEGGSDARSVEDLINEHISDERLGGPGSASEEDDPLAQMSEELTEETSDSDGREGVGDAGAERSDAETEVAETEAETDDAGATMDFETADEEKSRNDATSSSSEVPFEDDGRDTEPERRTGAEQGTEDEGQTEAERQTEPERQTEAQHETEAQPQNETEHETERGRNTELGRNTETGQEEPFSSDDESDDEGEGDGLLGRIGSLFK